MAKVTVLDADLEELLKRLARYWMDHHPEKPGNPPNLKRLAAQQPKPTVQGKKGG